MQVAEAMACGTPVVTARNSSLFEVGQVAVLFVRSMNVRELTDVLEQVITDPNLRSTLRARGLCPCCRFFFGSNRSEHSHAFTRAA